jgi:hypothetical protein
MTMRKSGMTALDSLPSPASRARFKIGQFGLRAPAVLQRLKDDGSVRIYLEKMALALRLDAAKPWSDGRSCACRPARCRPRGCSPPPRRTASMPSACLRHPRDPTPHPDQRTPAHRGDRACRRA